MDEKETTAPLNLKDKVAIVASAIAVAISIVSFFRDNLLGQHAMKVAVVRAERLGDQAPTLRANALIVNPGKHSEVLFNARLLFSRDINSNSGILSSASIGPIVVEPGKAVLESIESKVPTLAEIQNGGYLQGPRQSIHVSVLFDVLTPSGEERPSRQYKVVELELQEGAWFTRILADDDKGLVTLL
jgi:hypothetical protein